MRKFQKGEVWMTNRGNLYRVKAVENGQAILRKGVIGRGSISRRQEDATNGWILYVSADQGGTQ
ncbi:hypothetical protein [Pantoea stewartii]|uniref:hypothetical protein n=1 Tax=Pantoea stewartii TaxID=66269 RepID=UPI00197D4306|nr:hypothetical protein [Pantoea stewartii]